MSHNFKLRFACVLGATFVLFSTAWGDSLELKNGSMIKGRYLGGTERQINFRVGSMVQNYAVADVVAVTFDDFGQPQASKQPPAAPPEPSPYEEDDQPQASQSPRLVPRPPQSAPASYPVNGYITVHSGTRIMIRTVDEVDSRRNQVGDKFQATLEQPIIIDDLTVVPRGADIYGRLTQATQAGQIQGRSQLKLELTGIVVNNQTIPLITGEYSVSGSSRTASSAKRVGGGAALGAIIGAVAGGGKGAAIGAGVGAGAGTAVQVMTKGEQVHVPSETLLDFTLQQDVRMPVSDQSDDPQDSRSQYR